MNPVLARLLEQRDKAVEFVQQLLEQVDADQRELVDAERKNLESYKQRIAELDEQIKPLEEWEQTVAEHRAAKPTPSRRPAQDSDAPDRQARLGGVEPRPVEYPTAGHFIVDKIRAIGYPGEQLPPDPDALQRVSAALGRDLGAAGMQTRIQHQTTADTPGLLPEPIVGQIITDIDGSRPFLTSIGVGPLAGIPGKIFHRPHVTQHTQSGEQLAEKDELVSRQFKVEGIPFTKRTFGGTLNVSRQDIDWTSPSAWNALITDLQLEYGADTEDTAATEFAALVTQEVAVTDENDIKSWITALYQAAVMAATADGTRRATALRLPDHIWVSIDMWASLGAVISAVRAADPNARDAAGASRPTSFTGDVLDIPRTMAPGLPAGTVIVGRTALFEAYEERIGLLQAIEPKVLGVEVAYGGYASWGMLDATAFAKITTTGS